MGRATAEFEYRGDALKFVSREDDPLIKHQLSKKAFYELGALEQLALVVGKLRPSSTDWILDAGANIGNHTVYFAKYLGVGKVYSFEMNPETFQLLSENVENNNCSTLVSAKNVGLSNRKAVAGISAPRGNPLGGAQLDFEAGETLVHVDRLDSLLNDESPRGAMSPAEDRC